MCAAVKMWLIMLIVIEYLWESQIIKNMVFMVLFYNQIFSFQFDMDFDHVD